MNLVALVLLAIIVIAVVVVSRRRLADMRAAELAHKRLAQQLDGIVSNVPGVVWEAWDSPDESMQRVDFISDHVTRMLGYTVEEWLSTPNFWLTIVHPDDREAAAQCAHEHFLAGGTMTNTFRWMSKDGRAIWCEAHSTVIHDEAGNPVGMRGVTLDISARKRVADVVQEKAPKQKEDEPKSIYPDLRRKQILVVDREAEALDFTAELLRQIGIEALRFVLFLL